MFREDFIGDVICNRRLDLGYTQEVLCEGICDVGTLSRIENGKYPPTRSHAIALLRRLDIGDDRYYYLFGKDLDRRIQVSREVDKLYRCYCRSLDDDRAIIREKALQWICALEEMEEAGSSLQEQLVFQLRFQFDLLDNPIEKNYDAILRAIQYTHPRFQIDSIKDDLYSLDEIMLICWLGLAAEYEDGNRIFEQLHLYLDEKKHKITRPSRYVTPVCYYHAQFLLRTADYQQILSVAEEGIQSCLAFGFCRYLAGLIEITADAQLLCKYEKLAAEKFREAFCIYYETGNQRGVERLVNNRKKWLTKSLIEMADERKGLQFERK